MADFAISFVRYSADRSRVHKLRVRAVRGQGRAMGPIMEVTRTQVVAAIKLGRTFEVLRPDPAAPAAAAPTPVRLLETADWAYLRAGTDDAPLDQLEGVAEF